MLLLALTHTPRTVDVMCACVPKFLFCPSVIIIRAAGLDSGHAGTYSAFVCEPNYTLVQTPISPVKTVKTGVICQAHCFVL